ncbi:TraR/DksA family transcriptional regulator [Actibacterium sp.]|uniref:TraR/DksA family transcriptional regulator n=1 Tax=Actibacterium sp. TaxID=1872125 RepID=UPI00356622E2
MTPAEIAAYRTELQHMLQDLDTEKSLGAEATRTVTLDQQSVGRLSRMDAMQQQAMARAQQIRRDTTAARIRAALARIDADEFGYCVECGDDIAPARLHFDPTTPTCIGCAKG